MTTMLSPRLVLDFASATLNPIVGVTRSGNTATRYNASGLIETVNADLPRFNYDPVTLACRGLLIEEQRSNLADNSNDFAAWTKTRSSVDAAVVDTLSPDGTTNASKLKEDSTASNTHTLKRGIVSLTAATHTVSFFAKAAGRSWIASTNSSLSGTAVNFDLANGVIGTVGANATAYSIQPAGNGWYRCSASWVGISGTNEVTLFLANGNNGLVYTGDGTSGVFLYGFQVELGAFSTSYIPRLSASAATRNADVATITGTNFSDFWQASKGGVLVRARPDTVSGIRPWVQFDDNTADNIIALRGNTTNPELYIIDGGTPQAQIDAGTIAANTDYSLTGWWATNDCKARLDSGVVFTDTSATIPTVTQARLGSDGTNYLNGHLASISYYDSFSEQIYTRRKNKAVFNLM